MSARSPVDRLRLPVPGGTPPFAFPAIGKSALPNGLRVWTAEHRATPVVSLMLIVRRGAADDPPGKDGLAAITMDMLDEGSGGRSAIEMHEALAEVGGHLESDIGSDGAALSVTVLNRFADRALSVVADMMARPSLTEEDFARVRQLRLHRLRQLRDMPGSVADRAFVRLLYGGHPYGHTPLGSERTLASMTLDEVRRFHVAAMRPSEATLIAVGDCDHEAIARLAADAFGGWEGASAVTVPEPAEMPRPSRLNIVPRPGAPQSELRIGHVAAARNTPDYHALLAANMVLGGQFVSRINLNLREDKGFTYGARTSFEFRRLPGPFVVQASVHTASTAQAIEESLAEVAAIRGARPVTSDELSLGVAALTRGYARGFETADQVARAIAQIAMYDLSDGYFSEFVPRMEGVTVDDVTRVAAAHLDPSRLTTLIVGDLDTIADDLARLNLGAPTILPAETF